MSLQATVESMRAIMKKHGYATAIHGGALTSIVRPSMLTSVRASKDGHPFVEFELSVNKKELVYLSYLEVVINKRGIRALVHNTRQGINGSMRFMLSCKDPDLMPLLQTSKSWHQELLVMFDELKRVDPSQISDHEASIKTLKHFGKNIF